MYINLHSHPLSHSHYTYQHDIFAKFYLRDFNINKMVLKEKTFFSSLQKMVMIIISTLPGVLYGDFAPSFENQAERNKII